MPPANTVLLLLGLVLSIASGCSTDDDCEQLGSCVAGACVCSRGWSGPSCGSLNLLPAAPLATSRLWPSAEAHDAGFASAWGFTHTFEPSDNLHHGWVTVACGASGVVGQGGGNSFIAHVTAPSAIGPYALAATAPMFTPQTCFGPHVVRARDGTLALVFRVNLLINTTICAGDSAVPAPGIASHPSIPDSELVSGDPEKGTSIYIATAKTASGPWEVVRTEIVGDGTIHNSNPSLWQLLAPLPTGETWALGYRFNPKGGERNAIAVAHDVRGPWRSVANVSAGLSGAEDPFAFQVKSRGETKIAHMLYHNGPHGFHTWGPLDGSAPWRLSPTGSFAFTLNVTMASGGPLLLSRRERPELIFRDDGSPSSLIAGVIGPDGSAYSLLQDIA